MSIDDPEAFCAQFTEAGDCSFSDPAQGVFCQWVELSRFSIEAGTCAEAEPIGACYASNGLGTADGCLPPPGCSGDPSYVELDGPIGVYVTCGGSGLIAAQPCTYVEPGVFDPPECGCVCDEVGETGSTGSGSGGSESGG